MSQFFLFFLMMMRILKVSYYGSVWVFVLLRRKFSSVIGSFTCFCFFCFVLLQVPEASSCRGVKIFIFFCCKVLLTTTTTTKTMRNPKENDHLSLFQLFFHAITTIMMAIFNAVKCFFFFCCFFFVRQSNKRKTTHFHGLRQKKNTPVIVFLRTFLFLVWRQKKKKKLWFFSASNTQEYSNKKKKRKKFQLYGYECFLFLFVCKAIILFSLIGFAPFSLCLLLCV